MNGVAGPIVAYEPAPTQDFLKARRSVSVVMVVYMTGEALARSIECVLADSLVDQLVVVDNGSTRIEAARLKRLAEGGRNELPAPATKPAWLRFLAHFNDLLVYILIAAAALKAFAGDWVDFAVIAVVIVATALIGFIQEGRAASALAGLQTMQSDEAQALRDGTWGVVDAGTLVAGDVVRLRSGDRVPADLRLLTASSLQADEAALTGESVPSQKAVDAVAADAGVGDRSSMLFSGTIVTAGTAEGVVVAPGAGTGTATHTKPSTNSSASTE